MYNVFAIFLYLLPSFLIPFVLSVSIYMCAGTKTAKTDGTDKSGGGLMGPLKIKPNIVLQPPDLEAQATQAAKEHAEAEIKDAEAEAAAAEAEAAAAEAKNAKSTKPDAAGDQADTKEKSVAKNDKSKKSKHESKKEAPKSKASKLSGEGKSKKEPKSKCMRTEKTQKSEVKTSENSTQLSTIIDRTQRSCSKSIHKTVTKGEGILSMVKKDAQDAYAQLDAFIEENKPKAIYHEMQIYERFIFKLPSNQNTCAIRFFSKTDETVLSFGYTKKTVTFSWGKKEGSFTKIETEPEIEVSFFITDNAVVIRVNGSRIVEAKPTPSMTSVTLIKLYGFDKLEYSASL